jgi:hypothetical protein
MLDGQFRNNLKCRWTGLRSTVLDTSYIFQYIDSVAFLLDEAQQRHFDQWSILGTYVWPNPAPLAQTYQEEIDHLKQWIVNRITWLDANMPGVCSTAGETENMESSNQFSVYPNPAADKIVVDAYHHFLHDAEIMIYDIPGKTVLRQTVNKSEIFSDAFNIDISLLQSGIYFISVRDGDENIGMKKLVKK